MKTCSILLPFLLFISCRPAEQTNQFGDSTADNIIFSTELLTNLSPLFEYEIENERIAGAVTFIARNGDVVLEHAWGWQYVEEQKPLDTSHLFRIASMTKAITSVAILQLYEDGTLTLEDPVENYIPEFSRPAVLTEFDEETGSFETRPASRSITIHDLLTHTSGIAYGFTNSTFSTIYGNAGVPDLGTEENRTIEETMSILGGLPLAHDPGEQFTYGLNTDVLGRVVEVASGLSLNKYFREMIFLPLGMNDTFFYNPERQNDLVTLYTFRDGEFQLYPAEDYGLITPNYPVQGAMTYYSGGAGLTSTARDYAIFLQALLNGGELNGNSILRTETWDLMRSNQIGDLWEENKFGYGLLITTPEGEKDGLRPAGSLGWGGAFQTTYWIDTANEMVVVMMTQVIPSPYRDELYEEFERTLYSSLSNLP